jgi:predicted peptidase
MNRSARLGLILGGVLALLVPLEAGDTKRGFVNRVHKAADGTESKYVVFVPHDYQGDKAYPLILFLHGAGSKGNDGQLQMKGGLGPAIKKVEKSFQFIAVFPQAQKTWKADSDDGKRAMAILAEVQKAYKVDPQRIYLTGLSMGGAGTWSLAAAHPDRWAAIAPLCGRADLADASKIKDLPCWCFIGDQDKKDLVVNNRDMIKALKAAGGRPEYHEYPGVGHNCWDLTYAKDELYQWFLKHKSK